MGHYYRGKTLAEVKAEQSAKKVSGLERLLGRQCTHDHSGSAAGGKKYKTGGSGGNSKHKQQKRAQANSPADSPPAGTKAKSKVKLMSSSFLLSCRFRLLLACYTASFHRIPCPS